MKDKGKGKEKETGKETEKKKKREVDLEKRDAERKQVATLRKNPGPDNHKRQHSAAEEL